LREATPQDINDATASSSNISWKEEKKILKLIKVGESAHTARRNLPAGRGHKQRQREIEDGVFIAYYY
jgi:hypothetical protein